MKQTTKGDTMKQKTIICPKCKYEVRKKGLNWVIINTVTGVEISHNIICDNINLIGVSK